MLKEFKEFISKGNVVEMAVGLIMATYFGAIIKSLVNDLIMPVVGNILGGVDFNDLKLEIAAATAEKLDAAGAVVEAAKEAVTINYGTFINHIVVFVIVAFCVFLVVKGYNNMKKKMEKKKEEETVAAPPAPSKEEVLLGEIRDLLKK